MIEAEISQVRSFNRLVTQRVGALNDHYLARDRPLGRRAFWEIGREGCDVRRLRARLGLDSGYLSRLLRSLEAGQLVSVDQNEDDKRVRTARLTPAGLVERDLLERRSDDLARSFLESLSEPRRERLVAAMAEVELLLTAGLVEIRAVDPAERDAQLCLREYFAELGRRFETGFDPALSISVELHDLRPSAGVFLVATLRAEPIGCGALKFHGAEPAELKRMWVAGAPPGAGGGSPAASPPRGPRPGAGGPRGSNPTQPTPPRRFFFFPPPRRRGVGPFNGGPYAHFWF